MKTLLLLLGAFLTCGALAQDRPVPRPAMAARLAADEDVIGIVHWGLNTYTDREWGYGDEDPVLLNAPNFDADQIVQACKDGGLKGLVIVAKHHDGFCLWPTKTTEHNITKTPFWKGTGNGEHGRDYVKEMEQACRRAGLKFGVYCSPWDRNSAHYATDKYVEIYHAQLKELLGGEYGDIFEMWFDGANGGDGYYGGARERRKIGADYYRFGEVFKFVRELQPNVTIFAGERDDSDLRWCGNERGFVSDDSRATVVRTGGFCDGKFGNLDYVPMRNAGSPNGEYFRVNEADFPLRRGWFYHERERGTTKSGAYLARLYVGTVGNGGTMNIGVAPTKDGVLDADDVKALKDFGELRKALFAHEANDGEKFNVVVMREDVTNGELVDEWEFAADGNTILHGKSIGIKRIRLLKEPVVAKDCAVRVLRGAGEPKVSFALYRADQVIIDAILNAKGCEDETDTAKWMTGKASAPREYFVSPVGDDAADGSAAHPWRTIGRAASVAQAGDTVTVREGIYREWVKPANPGRDGSPRVSFALYRAPDEMVSEILNATGGDRETDTVGFMFNPKTAHAPSLLPEGKTFKLAWSDEFDGDRLDESKWSYRTNFWGRRAHWFAAPEDNAVEVKDGLLHLKLVKKADGQFVSPQLQTGELVWDVPHEDNPKGFWPLPKREKPKFAHRYGYYECRCKLQQKPGWWSAFWMQTPMQGCSLDPRRAGIEHDIMESFEVGEVIPHYFHSNGYGADYLGFCVPRRPKGVTPEEFNRPNSVRLDETQFHTFGMLWEPDGYTFFIDGRQHGEKVGQGEGEAVSQTEEFILLTTEAKWYRNDRMTGEGVPELEDAAASGDEFVVDYVRVYDTME